MVMFHTDLVQRLGIEFIPITCEQPIKITQKQTD